MIFNYLTYKKGQKAKENLIKYVIFKTKWGFFGLAGSNNGLLRTCLPLARREKVKSHLLQNLPDSRYDKALFKEVQEQIIAYFDGACVNFDKDIPIVLACPEQGRGNGFSLFARSILNACRDIKFGQTVSYGRLAEMAGKPGAARAVGVALAKNPLPLIIPCHRVIRADGKTCLWRSLRRSRVGGFSALGGITLKKRLLQLEQKAL
jgi:methylated-DNA-[protein]-cysteine S-methyltransferase